MSDSTRVSSSQEACATERPYLDDNEHHVNSLMFSLNRLRSLDMLTDLVVKSGSTEVRAHKCVLAAGSKYFEACFTSPMMESSTTEPLVLDVDETSLEAVVNYIYTGNIEITDSNYLHILDTANQLELPKLVEHCCGFLLSHLDVENCLGVHSLADEYMCHSLAAQAEQYIFRYFEDIVHTEVFHSLPFDRLASYLVRDELSMPSEEAVFSALITWIGHDPLNRSMHIGELLGAVRLQLVSPQFIAQTIHQCPSVRSSDAAIKLVLDAYQWHCLPDSDKPLGSKRKQYLRSKAIYSSLYVFGGDDGVNDGHPYSVAMYFDKSREEWVSVAPMSCARSVCGSASIGTKLYVVGGFDGERAMDSVEVFDCTSNSWSSLPPLQQRRCSCSCAVVRGQLYVVGGVCGPNALNHVECFDPVSQKWVVARPLLETRSACGVISLGDYIYAVGGINSQGDTVRTGEVFNTNNQEWRSISPMKEPRRSFALCNLDGLLYAIGGNNGSSDLKSVEEYDPVRNTWRPVAPMNFARMYCSAATFSGEIFAVGGVEDTKSLTSIERYDPKTCTWTVAESLPRTMCGCGIQVLDSVPMPPSCMGSKKRKAPYVDCSSSSSSSCLSTTSAAAAGVQVGTAAAGTASDQHSHDGGGGHDDDDHEDNDQEDQHGTNNNNHNHSTTTTTNNAAAEDDDDEEVEEADDTIL